MNAAVTYVLAAIVRVVAGTSGRVYIETIHGGRVQRSNVAFACGWLVEDPGPSRDADPEAWEAWGEIQAEAGPAGLVVECGAPAVAAADGWVCANGHRHLEYGSSAQQALEAQEALIEGSNLSEWDKEDAVARLYV